MDVVSSSDVIYSIRTRQTILFTFMLAKNKSVALRPVAKEASRYQELQVMFHTDVTQAVGEVTMDLIGALGEANTVIIVGHKFVATKGLASLYV